MILPDGTEWVLVPRVATEEMEAAGWIDKEDVCPSEIYASMLAAAPQPPVEEICAIVSAVIEQEMNWRPYPELARAIVKRLMGE